ncbi:multidrug efflux SMR transporter [Paenibacillus tritici]|uniref:Multidrug efflux SMR transporter n=1 Tax=Paenibacillus tritici TaxID=1873425 RepID=A0ABX2DJB7_9BACL|nr:multidrug efflux SMR transporter [Paenibacillus tritici]NQX44402.1 multidrug efflux SMR transporter [Paenibacillus tritici]
MAWLFLILGGILEVGWALGLAFSDGFTRIEIVIPTVIAMVGSFYLFAKSVRILPVSTAYAVFTGLGSFGTALAGMLFLGDKVSVIKIVLVITLIGCIIGLKFTSDQPQEEGA